VAYGTATAAADATFASANALTGALFQFHALACFQNFPVSFLIEASNLAIYILLDAIH